MMTPDLKTAPDPRSSRHARTPPGRLTARGGRITIGGDSATCARLIPGQGRPTSFRAGSVSSDGQAVTVAVAVAVAVRDPGRSSAIRSAAGRDSARRAGAMAITYYKRFRMEIDLAGLPSPGPLPAPFSWVGWDEGLVDRHAEVK
jgi:hypothetical protein